MACREIRDSVQVPWNDVKLPTCRKRLGTRGVVENWYLQEGPVTYVGFG